MRLPHIALPVAVLVLTSMILAMIANRDAPVLLAVSVVVAVISLAAVVVNLRRR